MQTCVSKALQPCRLQVSSRWAAATQSQHVGLVRIWSAHVVVVPQAAPVAIPTVKMAPVPISHVLTETLVTAAPAVTTSTVHGCLQDETRNR